MSAGLKQKQAKNCIYLEFLSILKVDTNEKVVNVNSWAFFNYQNVAVCCLTKIGTGKLRCVHAYKCEKGEAKST